MGKGYLIVEGHGDGRAALNLVHRVWADLGLPRVLWDDNPVRGVGLHTRLGVVRASEILRAKPFHGDVEAIRGVKEWLSRHFASGKAYKPTLDQLPMAQMVDLHTVRAAGVPSFGTFERALRFLSIAGAGEVYPPPSSVAR
jgi:hypothetical protein